MGQRAAATAIEEWLLGEAMDLELVTIVEGLGHRLAAAGVPVDRLVISFGILNPALIAAGLVWRPDQPVEFMRYAFERRDSGLYERSPFKLAEESGRWVELDLARTPDDAFAVVPDLKRERLAHYIAIPLPRTATGSLILALATRAPAGFSAADRITVGAILPALRATVEVKTLRAMFRDVLGTYVGRAPAREIVRGTVHRGQVTTVRAAILVADLRGFTHLSTRLPPEATADVLNRYYDMVVPPIEAAGGEVLKYVGDAVLAIFPAVESGDAAAALAGLDAGATALASARSAARTQAAAFDNNGERITIHFGVALHIGDAAYGNVGSGDRLDFTVIGRDVNIAARIAALCSSLGQDYLVSETVAALGRARGRAMQDAGAHAVRGLDRPLRVFAPDAAGDDGIV